MSAVVVALLWQRFICKACGLIYDEAEGDADSGIAPGTRFADIPDDWCCPLCGVTKADFEAYDETPLPSKAARAGSPVRSASNAGIDAAPQRRQRAGIVIVGAGRAGWKMAEALRERDPSLPITLVSSGDAAVYDKPLLSVAFARGLGPEALVRDEAGAAARRLGVRLLAHTQAVSIAAGSHRLRTTRGSLPYDHLVLAHGAEPRAMPTLPASLCWRINDLATYLRFRTALGAPSTSSARGEPADVLIVGAGLVGCELANDLALAGYAITLLDLADRPLAALLDPERSARLLEAWQTLPIRFVGHAAVRGVQRSAGDTDSALHVATEDGRAFAARHLLAATGLETPSRLARGAGLAWDHGIAVDPRTLATSDPRIHALGDCISIEGRSARYIEPITRQARTIADRITGRPAAPYANTHPPTRIKTTSLPLTV